MLVLLDTHLLLWAGLEPERLSDEARTLISDTGNDLFFSAASVWEMSIKSALRRDDFSLDPYVLRRSLLQNGYAEVAIEGSHAAAVRDLPPLHRDPFDRVLVAQARCEGMTLLTSDARVAEYGAPVRLV